MAWMEEIEDVVSRYTGSSGGAAAAQANPHQDYVDIANSAPPQVMADALSHTFRSDQTPSFPEMVSSLFRQSSSDQRAGVLSQLLQKVGPAALAGLPAQSALAGILGGRQSVTPDTAAQVSAEQVQQIATQAQKSDPSVIDRVSAFYAQHPGVVKALGGAAISIAIQRIASRSRA
jgi:hypothetical protein